MSNQAEGIVRIEPAATVMLLRDTDSGLRVLLLQRETSLAFHGGAWVFPGGRVEQAEHHQTDPVQAALRAAVRETREEAGLTLDATKLLPFSHWTTPEGRARRFATWFFLTHYEGAEEGVADGSEIRALRWLSPAEALAAHQAREIELPPPTFVTLSVLDPFKSARDALEAVRGEPPFTFLPRPRSIEGGVVSLYAGDVAYESGDPSEPGPRHRLSMLADGWRYERNL